jgi:mannose/fructose-specific phosphotransferase system component IIA
MESVLGPQPNVRWLSNTGKTPAALLAGLEELVRAEGAGRDVYLLSDLKGGSCALACLRTARTSGVRAVLHGANLTLLLEFVMLQHLPAGPFLDALLEKTRASVGATELDGGAGEREPAGAESADGAGATAGAPEGARRISS